MLRDGDPAVVPCMRYECCREMVLLCVVNGTGMAPCESIHPLLLVLLVLRRRGAQSYT